jgi:phosphoglycerol transferase
MRGRSADWQAQLIGYPATVLAPAAAAAGFDGIYVDRLGYKGASAQRLESALTRLLGVRPLVSRDGRFSFFDARAYTARLRAAIGPVRWLALGEATLHPVWLEAGAGSRSPPPPDFPISGVGIHGPVWVRGTGVLDVVDPSRQERSVLFTARLSSDGGNEATTMQFPDGARLRFMAGARPVAVCRSLTVGRGSRIIVWTVGDGTVRLDGAQLTSGPFLPFLGPGCVSPVGA